MARIGDILGWKITKSDGSIIKVEKKPEIRPQRNINKTLANNSGVQKFSKKRKKSLEKRLLKKEEQGKLQQKTLKNLADIERFHSATCYSPEKSISPHLFKEEIDPETGREVVFCLECRKRHPKYQLCPNVKRVAQHQPRQDTGADFGSSRYENEPGDF
jgi:hypothetical protein